VYYKIPVNIYTLIEDGEDVVYKSIIDYILPLLIYIIDTSITVSKDLEEIIKCGITFNIRKINGTALAGGTTSREEKPINSYRSKIIRNFIGVF
jgi:hypothetical protein